MDKDTMIRMLNSPDIETIKLFGSYVNANQCIHDPEFMRIFESIQRNGVNLLRSVCSKFHSCMFCPIIQICKNHNTIIDYEIDL